MKLGMQVCHRPRRHLLDGVLAPPQLFGCILSRTYQLAGRRTYVGYSANSTRRSPEIYNKYVSMSHESHKDNGKTVRDGIPLTTFS